VYSEILDAVSSNFAYSKKNREITHRFISFCMAEGLSRSRLTRIIYYLDRMNEQLGCDFDRLDRESAEVLFARIGQMEWSTWTKSTYKALIKKFYRWLDEEKYMKYLRFRIPRPASVITPQDLFTRDDIEGILEVSDMDMRLLISLLYETGARIGEAMNLRAGDITFDDFGALVRLDGKTGVRIVRVVEISAFLSDFLRGIAKDSRLFIKSYQAYSKRLKRTCRTCGIYKKKISFHIFRHTRASYLAQFLTEPQLKKYMGWANDSKMLSVYVHLSQRDVNEAIVRIHSGNAYNVVKLNNKY